MKRFDLKFFPVAGLVFFAVLPVSCMTDKVKAGPTVDEIEIIGTGQDSGNPDMDYEECIKMADVTSLMIRKANAYTEASQTEGKELANSVYVYAASLEKYKDEPEKLAARIALLGFKCVYVSPGGGRLVSADSWLRSFISACTGLGMDVYATYYEDPEVFVSEAAADACLQKVLLYNRSVSYQERFAGVSADLEPHTIKTDIGLGWIWNTDTGNGIGGPNDSLLKVTLERLGYASDRLHTSGLGLHEAIWCHYQGMFDEGKVSNGDIDQFADVCDRVSLMAYSNSTESIWRICTPAMDACGKEKCINICVKTATNDEPVTTIQPNGWNALLETMQSLKERGLGYKCFSGIDVFHYDALETMWEWVNDKN